MTFNEVLEEVRQLPRAEKASLLEYLRGDLENRAQPDLPEKGRSLLELEGFLSTDTESQTDD